MNTELNAAIDAVLNARRALKEARAERARALVNDRKAAKQRRRLAKKEIRTLMKQHKLTIDDIV